LTSVNYCAYFLLSLALVFTSCVTEEEPIQNPTNKEFSLELQEVKNWFDKNKAEFNPTSSNSQAREFSKDLILPFFNKEPDWSKFTEYYFADGRKVYEVHISNLSGIMPVEFFERYGNQNDELIEESLLFVSETNSDKGFTVLVARYYSFGAKPKGMTYHQIPEGWNGQIDIFTYADRHLRTITIEKGQLISHTRYQTVAEKESSRKYSALMSCFGSWQDFPYFGDPMDGSVAGPQSVYSVNCYFSGGGGSGSSSISYDGGPDYGSGGGGSSGNPGNPTGSQSNDESNNFCRDNHCIPFPEERDEIIKDPSFQGTNADCIFEKLKSINGFNQVSGRFDGVTSELDVVFKIGATEDPTATGQTQWMGSTSRPIEITLNSNLMGRSALEVARTILHEMIHAEIYGAIKTNSPTTEDLSFRDTFEEYTKRYSGNNAIHHNLMADKFVKYMADVLQQIHPQLGGSAYANFMNYPEGYPNGVPREFYEALAWAGLKDASTIAYQSLSAAEKAEITGHLIKAESGRKSCN